MLPAPLAFRLPCCLPVSLVILPLVLLVLRGDILDCARLLASSLITWLKRG
jgi:hypothetical protein